MTRTFSARSSGRFSPPRKWRPKLHYLLGKPTLASNARQYGRAKKILNSCAGLTLIEEDEAADFGRELERRVLASGHFER